MKGAGRPYLIGHRGWPAACPENTLSGFRAALAAGADAVECDIQFSADGVPMVIHDFALRRTVGRPGSVGDYTANELQKMSAHEPKRFTEHSDRHPIATLGELVALLGEFPAADIFIEIKEESLINFSREHCVACCLAESAVLAEKAKIISFDRESVAIAQQAGAQAGWVIRDYDDVTRELAEALGPHYLIADARKLPAPPVALWEGPWRWFLYDLVDTALIEQNLARSVSYIETWDVGLMIEAFSTR